MNVPAKADIMEAVLIKGDLSKLTSEERVRYYNELCHSLGLNPLTRPFEYINLGGKTVLYAKRDCTDQLRKINSVSVEIVSQKVAGDILTVHARARQPDGRTDEDFGSVYYPETLTGEVRANAGMRAVTKSKRRVTLSICGLGWLSEEEIDDIPVQHRRPPPPAPNAMIGTARTDVLQTVGATASARPDPETGELPPPAPNTGAVVEAASSANKPADGAALPVRPVERPALASEQSETKLASTKQEPKDGEKSPDFGETAALSAPGQLDDPHALDQLEAMAKEAALRGRRSFVAFWKQLSPAEQEYLTEEMGNELRGLMS